MLNCLSKLLQRSLASKVTSHQEAIMAKGVPKRSPLEGVANVVIVASGKGGVGKSTVAVNLAATLAKMGKRVGLLDADIFGPSIPLMMNIHEEPLVNDNNLMIPPINYGVKCMSMGLITRQGDAIIWRGPLVMSAIQRLLKGTVWSPLDILVIDTPPGTGDIHLSLAQNIPIDGILLVSTPQTAALEVTLRGAQMYKTLKVPILGLASNMSYAVCENCKSKMEVFKYSSEKLFEHLNAQILASIPIDSNITDCCDAGIPVVLKYAGSEYAKSFVSLAQQILNKLQTKHSAKSVK